MLTKIGENYPTLIREFGGCYRVSRKVSKISYKDTEVSFVVEQNTPDIYGSPAWKVLDTITPNSKHYQWTRLLIESLYQDINSIPEPAPLPPIPASSDPWTDVLINPDTGIAY